MRGVVLVAFRSEVDAPAAMVGGKFIPIPARSLYGDQHAFLYALGRAFGEMAAG